MKKHLNNKLIPKGRTIYFDEDAHKYSNELGITYTSTTTVVGKYTVDFKKEEIAKACEKIGRNPNHAKYNVYKGKSYKQILKEWETTTKESCEFGTLKHNYLEQSVKSNNDFNRKATGFLNGQIYTIDDILIKPNFGRLNLNTFKKYGIDERYPDIYNALRDLTKAGYYIYAEIGVYDDLYGVSGLIDILCVNHDTYEFIIIDWKTNKSPMRFDCGYYAKHEEGAYKGLLNLDKWIAKDEFFKYPLNSLADSTGNHYTMQLSTYAYLVSTFGLKCKALLLFHIRPIENPFYTRDKWDEVIEKHPINYLENEAKIMLNDFSNKQIRQTSLFL